MVGVLAQHQVGAGAGGGDVLDEVGLVDRVPDARGLVDGLVVGEGGVLAEVRRRVAEGGLAQAQEAVDVPALDVGQGGVDVDGEVEEVADRQAGAAVVAHAGGLEDVEALDDHDVGALHHDLLVGDHVVDEVGVDRRLDLVAARLDVDDELQQRLAVVGLREALAVQEPAALELGVGEQEAVGRDERDVGVLGPVGEHLLQHAGGGRLADRDRAGEADHERRTRRGDAVEELLLLAVQPRVARDVEAEQAGEREVDLLDLVAGPAGRPGRAGGGPRRG